MRPIIIYILITFALSALYSCGKQQTGSDTNKNDSSFDFTLFYHVNESNECIYDAHRKVPLGKMVTLDDLDNLFGEPFVCNTVKQALGNRSLYEQEFDVAKFLPTEVGDTLVMMRRLYGKEGNWIIWIDLEVQESDSLRVLNFIAYDNSQVDI